MPRKYIKVMVQDFDEIQNIMDDFVKLKNKEYKLKLKGVKDDNRRTD